MTAHTPRPSRAFRTLLLIVSLTLPCLARAASEPFVWPGWHVPADQVQFVESRLHGDDLERWMNGFGPPPTQDPLEFLRGTPPIVDGVPPGPWSPVPPPARWAHSLVYDSIRDRLLVFGGQGYSSWSDELWALNLSGIPEWTPVATGGTTPSPRGFHSAVFDSISDRLIVFGGSDGTLKNEVWALSFAGLATWTKLTVAGTPPAARQYHTAVIDRARNRMLVFGGSAGGASLSDVWALNLTGAPTWTPLAAQGPAPARQSHAAVYDRAGDRMIVLTGLDGSGQVKNDVWALSLAGTPTWSALAPTGTPPSARLGASAIYDRLRSRVVLFAGGTGAPNTNEAWTLSLTGTPAWTLLAPTTAPQGRQFHGAVYDPIGDRMLVFGGSSGPVLSDAWSLSLGTTPSWRPFSTTRRKGHSAAFDTARRRMLIFGGESSTQLNDVWEMTLDGAMRSTRLNPEGTPPSPRALHAAVYDGRRDRMLVFGGRGTTPTNDVWELSFFGELAWRPILPAGTPPSPRMDATMILDPGRQRILVFGGADASGVFNDVWALSLSGAPTWTPIVTTGGPPTARGAAQAIYDPVRDRLVIHGGYNRTFIAQSDVWALSLGGATPTWTLLAPSGVGPQPRLAGAAVYDLTRDRMLISDGTDFAEYFSDVWALNFLGATSSWTPLSLPGVGPTARSDHKAIYDEDRDRLVFFGGFSPLGILHDAWELDFTQTVDAGPAPAAPHGAVALASIAPNPAAGPSTIAFTLASAGPARVTIHDALGRRVRLLSVESPSAGAQRVVWDGRDDGGARAPVGLYFVRIEAAGEAVAGKLVRTQ